MELRISNHCDLNISLCRLIPILAYKAKFAELCESLRARHLSFVRYEFFAYLNSRVVSFVA